MANFNPEIIKPSRLTSKSPELKITRCIKNYRTGIETSLTLDLNILSKMREVVATKNINFATSGLATLVKFLNKAPGLHLCPGIAISEAHQDYLESLMDSYEVFLKKHCPSYIDTPNATKNYKNVTSKPSTFTGLSKGEKYFNAVAYLGIIRTQIEDRKNSNDPITKFKNYLSYMTEKADMVGAIESEAAKYVFNDTSTIKDNTFKHFAQKIKKNFKKGGESPEKVIKSSLNSARDIMYYRATATHSNERLDGKLQDTWLVTADEGLFNLSKSIHFVPNLEGSDSKYFSLVRCNEQKKSPYWNYCDSAIIETINLRQITRELSNTEYYPGPNSLDSILECISDSESELSSLIKSQL